MIPVGVKKRMAVSQKFVSMGELIDDRWAPLRPYFDWVQKFIKSVSNKNSNPGQKFWFTCLICHFLFANENCEGFDKHKFMHIDEKDSFAFYILAEDFRKMKVVKGTQEVITKWFINLKIFLFEGQERTR